MRDVESVCSNETMNASNSQTWYKYVTALWRRRYIDLFSQLESLSCVKHLFVCSQLRRNQARYLLCLHCLVWLRSSSSPRQM